jgi:gamma-butyrobetaine dioxygenase
MMAPRFKASGLLEIPSTLARRSPTPFFLSSRSRSIRPKTGLGALSLPYNQKRLQSTTAPLHVTERSPEKSPENSPENFPDNPFENSPGSSPRKSPGKPPRKSPEESPENTSGKTPEKNPENPHRGRWKGSFDFEKVKDPDAWSVKGFEPRDLYIFLCHSENKQWVAMNRHALRDACECNKCVDPHSGQKNFGTTDIPDQLSIQSCRRLEDASLEIVWEDDFLSPAQTHVSVFPPSTVRTWFNRNHRRSPSLPKAILWDKDIFAASPSMVTYDDWVSGGPKFHAALAQLSSHGLIFIDNVPQSEESVVTIATQIGHVMETFYGRTWDVRSKPEAENVAYTNTFLGLHQDLLYTRDPPRIQLLHCLENSCEGGGSIFSDSRRVSRLMRRGPAHLFQALENQKLRYHYKKHGHFYEQERTVLQKEDDTVFWSPPFQSPDQPILKTLSGSKGYWTWRKAAKAFRKLLEDEQWLYEYKLKPGQCVVFDNLRVLHGRRRFDNSSGSRWLKGTYVSNDEWNSKIMTLARKIKASSKARRPNQFVQAQILDHKYKIWSARTKQNKSMVMPDESVAEPDKSVVVSDDSVVVSDDSVEVSDKPLVVPDELVAESEKSVAVSNEPVAESDKPLMSDESVAESDKPAVASGKITEASDNKIRE